jgi:hypothetical protein
MGCGASTRLEEERPGGRPGSRASSDIPSETNARTRHLVHHDYSEAASAPI